MQVKLKICGMKLPANILEVAALQPDYMGFIFYPKSKRYVDHLEGDVLSALPSGIKKTGVFVDEPLDGVLKRVTAFGLAAVQLHGQESAAYCSALKHLLPEAVEIIKAFGVDEKFDFNVLEIYVPVVDYFLFDTQTPDHGGSGKTFNWTLLDRYRLDKPYFLSGGIGPDSAGALARINDERLYAIDVNSRFEFSPGLKNTENLKNFKNKLSL